MKRSLNTLYLIAFLLVGTAGFIYHTVGFRYFLHLNDQQFDEASTDAAKIKFQYDFDKFEDINKTLEAFAKAENPNEFGNDQFTDVMKFMVRYKNLNSCYLGVLSKWAQKTPKSPMPYIVLSEYYVNTAKANYVPDSLEEVKSSPSEYFEYISKAKEFIDYAASLNPNLPFIYLRKLQLARLNNDPEEVQSRIFNEGISKFPNYYELYSERLYQLTPKWFGNNKLMLDFVNKYKSDRSFNSKRPFLVYYYHYLNVYNICEGKTDCDFGRRSGEYLDKADVQNDIINTLYTTQKAFPRIIEQSAQDAAHLIFVSEPYFSEGVEPGFKLLILNKKAFGENYATMQVDARYSAKAEHYDQAQMLLEESNKDLARSDIRSESSKASIAAKNYFNLSEIYLTQKVNFEKATYYLNKAIEGSPYKDEYHLANAYLNILLNNKMKASLELTAGTDSCEREMIYKEQDSSEVLKNSLKLNLNNAAKALEL